MADTVDRIGRIGILLAGILLGALAGWYVFLERSSTLADLAGVLLVLGTIGGAARTAGRVGTSLFPEYNVAEVAVEGPITRDGGRPVPTGDTGTPADDIVDQIERADEDDSAKALLLKLNTPGGEVVPSDDIRIAAREFDGPTIAYATDTCASGGYWIASGCDEFWARDASIVGSIGVILSQVTAGGFLEKAGLTYEGITAGEYKDSLTSLKDLEDDEREYLQGITDDFYANFVERVADGRDLDPEEIRDTEARIYLGEAAAEHGLVDELGRREDIEAELEYEIGEPVTVEEFEPDKGITDRISVAGTRLAYAFGAGLASVVGADRVPRFEA
ncbi:MAG: signal peptide peptidase SppA [Halobacteriales archaeon]